MGTVVACGGGFDEFDGVWAMAIHLRSLTGKEHPRFLLVPTTQFDVPNPGTLNCYYKLGCSVDTLKLTENWVTPDIMEQKIAEADIIWTPGGNLRFAEEVWRKTGAAAAIRRAFERGAVVCGSSAGAMIWFETGFDNCEIYDRKVMTKGLGLFPYAFCPHYQSENWQCFDEAVKTQPLSAFAAENGAALCIPPDGRAYVFRETGSERVWFFDAENHFEKRELTSLRVVYGEEQR